MAVVQFPLELESELETIPTELDLDLTEPESESESDLEETEPDVDLIPTLITIPGGNSKLDLTMIAELELTTLTLTELELTTLTLTELELTTLTLTELELTTLTLTEFELTTITDTSYLHGTPTPAINDPDIALELRIAPRGPRPLAQFEPQLQDNPTRAGVNPPWHPAESLTDLNQPAAATTSTSTDAGHGQMLGQKFTPPGWKNSTTTISTMTRTRGGGGGGGGRTSTADANSSSSSSGHGGGTPHAAWIAIGVVGGVVLVAVVVVVWLRMTGHLQTWTLKRRSRVTPGSGPGGNVDAFGGGGHDAQGAGGAYHVGELEGTGVQVMVPLPVPAYGTGIYTMPSAGQQEICGEQVYEIYSDEEGGVVKKG